VLYAGLDEVGYGALAGPIVVVAVALEIPLPLKRLREFWPLQNVKDSKKTTPAQRERLRSELSGFLVDVGAFVGVGTAPVRVINKYGYSSALANAKNKAIKEIVSVDGARPDLLILDGNIGLPRYGGPQRCIPGADDKFWVAAAASILAKITRDDMMIHAARRHPQYGWESNKGYYCPKHIAALVKHGLTRMHRIQPCTTALDNWMRKRGR